MNAPTTMIMIVMSLEETTPKGMRNFVCLFVCFLLAFAEKEKKNRPFIEFGSLTPWQSYNIAC